MTAAWTMTDLMMMKSEIRWTRHAPYVEQFAPGGPTPVEKPTLREWMLAEGFWADEIDAYLARQEERQAEVDRQRADAHHHAAEREALERTWRFRADRWLTIRADRVRLAAEVLRGKHTCGDEW